MDTHLTETIITEFWQNYYKSTVGYTRLTECTSESAILQLFTEKYSQYRHMTHQTLTREFNKITSSTQTTIRRFSSNKVHYFNAQRLPENKPADQKLPENKSTDHINFTLLNTQGIITRSNKPKFIYDMLTGINSEHVVAITETNLTKDHLDA